MRKIGLAISINDVITQKNHRKQRVFGGFLFSPSKRNRVNVNKKVNNLAETALLPTPKSIDGKKERLSIGPLLPTLPPARGI